MIAAVLTLATVLLASAAASAATKDPSDPQADSPTGAVYQIPLQGGRSDAAPRHTGSNTSGRGGGGGIGGGSGGSGGSGTSGGLELLKVTSAMFATSLTVAVVRWGDLEALPDVFDATLTGEIDHWLVRPEHDRDEEFHRVDAGETADAVAGMAGDYQ